nr:MAG TPA: hypothetical protein [Caudoviricetes sp.]
MITLANICPFFAPFLCIKINPPQPTKAVEGVFLYLIS